MKASQMKQYAGLIMAMFITISTVRADETLKASTWVVEDGSSPSASIMTGLGGSALTIAFEQLADTAFPTSPTADIIIGGSDPSNMFSGNIAANGYSGIRFRITGDGTEPAAVTVWFRRVLSSSQHVWEHFGVEVSPTAGEWVVVEIPFSPDKEWVPYHTVGERYTLEETWAQDLANVDGMFLKITRNGNAAQRYSVADFQLVGPGMISEPARLTPLQAYFGVDSVDQLTAADLARDSNGDGMSDYQAILAGLDPMDASATFATDVEKAEASNVIRWQGMMGGRYAVLRSNNLVAGFDFIAQGLTPAFSGQEMVFEDTSPVADAPNFYRIVKY